jgi:hypothetical protein
MEEMTNIFELLKPWLNLELFQAEQKRKKVEETTEGYLLELEEAGVPDKSIEQIKKEMEEESSV